MTLSQTGVARNARVGVYSRVNLSDAQTGRRIALTSPGNTGLFKIGLKRKGLVSCDPPQFNHLSRSLYLQRVTLSGV